MEALRAIGPIGSVSEKYVFVSSTAMVRKLSTYGYQQTDYRQQGEGGFSKHLIRMRKFTALGISSGEFHEVVIINSHNASCALQIYAGVFRSVCMNGIIVGDLTAPAIKVRHLKGSDFMDDFEASFEKYLDNQASVEFSIDMLKNVYATTERQDLFREKVNKKLGKQYDLSLTFRKRFDDTNDLWIMYNNAQERILRGTAMYVKNGVLKRQRPVIAIDNTLIINKILWNAAIEVAQEC